MRYKRFLAIVDGHAGKGTSQDVEHFVSFGYHYSLKSSMMQCACMMPVCGAWICIGLRPATCMDPF